jgi:hypothetical protein
MPSPHQRAQPRVTYPADVRLFADRFDQPLTARSRDLGPTGIFVEANERLAVGTPVICEVALPSGPVRLAGLVARAQTLKSVEGGERVGMGIQFVNIDDKARGELQSLIPSEERARQLVAIHLEGMKDALRSEAIVTSDGLRVTATLPFLRDGGEVKVAFLSGSARVESRSVVRDVRLTAPGPDGAPRLELRLQFAPAVPAHVEEPPENRDEVTEVTAVDTPSGIATAALTDTPSGRATAALGEILTRDRALTRPSTGEDPNTTVRVRTPIATASPRRASPAHTMSAIPVSGDDTGRYVRTDLAPPVGKRAAVAALALAAGLALVAFGAILNRFVIGGRLSAAPPPRGPVVTARPLPTPRPPINPPPPALPEVIPAPVAAAPVAVAAAPAPAGQEAAPEAQTLPQPAWRLASAPSLAASTPTAAAANGIVTLPVGTPGPEVTSEGDQIVAVVPIEGSTAGAVHYALTQPRGLAVELPQARAALPVGRHAVFNDGFRFISIREREGGGLRLAFTYAYYTPRLLDVTIEDKAIRVRVAPPK